MTRMVLVLGCLAPLAVADDGGNQSDAPNHWAFTPVVKPAPPATAAGSATHPIDRFVRARLRANNIEAVGQADPRALVRRVYFDLIGLPPTPAEAAAFLADDSPQAFRRLVDRLLASPRYGERWGRYWMDVVRYADTAGDNADYPVPEARLYRDYIIDAFNADKPYDQFVREQLAGDLLAKQGPRDKHAERVIATGFLALTRRYATAPYELWHVSLEDTIETTGRAFMGLTLRCARCHDHKFDPVTMRDYYGLYGVFASTTFPYAGSEEFQSKSIPRKGFVPLVPADEAAPILAAHRKRIDDINAKIKQIEAQPADKRSKDTNDELNQLRDELRIRQRPGLPPDLPGAYAVTDGTPTEVAIQNGGDPGRPGPVVKRAVIECLAGTAPPTLPADRSGRLEFAQWLTDPAHPLTARVMVNRIWQHHFGTGIVATPSNFGRQGAPPTHPKLLDYLAARFVESGWSVKAMHRLILASNTYQLASTGHADNAAKDPDNRWLWQHPRRRLDAEAIRDAMLFIAGNLDLSRPGPHPFPPIKDWHWSQHNPFKAVYPSNHRSVYLMTQRIQRHPYLGLFDGPDTNTSTAVRTNSTVPLQALFMLNNEFVHTQAKAFAKRLLDTTPDTDARIDLAHQLAWSRPPTPTERVKAKAFLDEYQQALTGTEAEQVENRAWTSYAQVMLSASAFMYID